MNIPQKFYDMLEGLSFTYHAVFLALVTEYIDKGTVNAEATGYALDLFMDIKPELDQIIRRREYSRKYRERKKAQARIEAGEKKRRQVSEKPGLREIPVKAEAPEKPCKLAETVPDDNGSIDYNALSPAMLVEQLEHEIKIHSRNSNIPGAKKRFIANNRKKSIRAPFLTRKMRRMFERYGYNIVA